MESSRLPPVLKDYRSTRLSYRFILPRIQTASLGFYYNDMVYDLNTKTHKTVRRTRWETHLFNTPLAEAKAPATDPDSQIYASYQYRRQYLDNVRTALFATTAVRFHPSMLDSPDGSTRRVEPFRMRKVVAVGRVYSRLVKRMEIEAETYLKREYGADVVSGLELDVTQTEKVIDSVYVPMFVFTSQYGNTTLRTFVNGATGQVGGQVVYDGNRIGFFAGTLFVAWGALMTGSFGLSSLFWFVIPALIARIGAMYWVLIRLAFFEHRRKLEELAEGFMGGEGEETGRAEEEARRRADQQQQQQQRQGQWQWDFRFDGRGREQQSQQDPFGPWREAFRRARQEAEGSNRYGGYGAGAGSQYGRQGIGQRARTDGSRATPVDPLGFYQTLGVRKDASKEDIQAAFRGMALKHHPDRFTDPTEKEKAKERFQKISEAYSVLRDGTLFASNGICALLLLMSSSDQIDDNVCLATAKKRQMVRCINNTTFPPPRGILEKEDLGNTKFETRNRRQLKQKLPHPLASVAIILTSFKSPHHTPNAAKMLRSTALLALAALVPASLAQISDNFENGSSQWSTYAPDCNQGGSWSVTSGGHSGNGVTVKGAGGYCGHIFFGTKSVPSGDLYVRFWAKFSSAFTSSHVSFLTMDDATTGKHLRMGGQSGILMFNRESDDATLPNLSPDGIAQSKAITANQWTCIEFHVGSGKIETWVNDAALPGLTTGSGSYTSQFQSGAMNFKITSVNFGWESYGGDVNTVVYDDIAISSSRNGCSGSGSGSTGGGQTTQPQRTTTTTTRVQTTQPQQSTTRSQPMTTTTTRAQTTTTQASSGGNCAAKYGQCGGQGFSGPTCCQSGSTCKFSNNWYSQCL
ncbi:hypothetical protein HDV00_009438 [Rhizophlyctis rosea]|nr:hypothetical protein HDV00_009438 [Rhizophlyctis rosea]